MISWHVHRARATRVLANLFVIAGFLAVVPLIAAVFLPTTPLLAFVPELPAGVANQIKNISWIPGDRVIPVVVALAGLVAMLVGRGIASRQLYIIEGYRRWREDAQRRVHHYRSDGRIEPTLQ